MTNHVLSPDTQATLLLCASFGQKRDIEPKPLTLGEYNNLASWLKSNDLTPKNLLDSIIQDKLPNLDLNQLESSRILALLNRGVMLSLALEKWTSQGLWILGRGDSEYPKRLKQKLKYKAPAIIYGVGDKKLLTQGGLAIVGSRNIDDSGLEYTQKLTQTCAQQKIQVISGGAKGVDQTSMLGTLDAGGTVVGVVADSLARAVLAKKYRQGIQAGRLTLISTYDPNAGFNVGNAMGRNKYIYALADYGLVVNSTPNKGGTWAGATEALKKITDVPVFVRVDKNISQGNYQLLEKGAIPFPEIPSNICLTELITAQILDFPNKRKPEISIEQPSLLNNNNISELNLQEVRDQSSTEPGENSHVYQDIYEAVLPFILRNLETPKNDKYLAESLEIQLGQMRAWLKRAVKEGKIKKNKKPVTYEINKTQDILALNI